MLQKYYMRMYFNISYIADTIIQQKKFFDKFEKKKNNFKKNKFFDTIQITIIISNKIYFYTIEKDIQMILFIIK